MEALLKDVRDAIDADKITFDQRKPKNTDTLLKLGLTIDEAYQEVYDLDTSNYISGPEEHHQHPGINEVWKFKKTIFAQTVYIKLWVMYSKNGNVAVMSFHLDNI